VSNETNVVSRKSVIAVVLIGLLTVILLVYNFSGYQTLIQQFFSVKTIIISLLTAISTFSCLYGLCWCCSNFNCVAMCL